MGIHVGNCNITYDDIVDAMAAKLKDDDWVLVGNDETYMARQRGSKDLPRPLAEVIAEVIAERVAWRLPQETPEDE